MVSDIEAEEARAAIHGSWELKVQIVALALVVLVLACILVILPLLFKPVDPVISLIFAGLVAVTSVFLGGSIMYGYSRVKVGADARMIAEEMVDKALDGDGGVLSNHRMELEDMFEEEKQRLAEDFELQKKAYYSELQREFNRRLDEEENSYVEELKNEFDRRLDAEKNAYVEHVKADFEMRLEDEKNALEEVLKADAQRRLEEEKARGVPKEQVEEEKKAAAEKVKLEYETRLDERDKAADRARQDLESKLDEERKAAQRIKQDFEARVEEERKGVERVRQEFDARMEGERKAYMDIVRKDFEDWKREFADDFRKEIMRDVKPLEPVAEPPAPVVRQEPKPEPPTRGQDDLGDIFTKPQEKPAEPAAEPPLQRREREYNFYTMNTDEKVDAAVELLQSPKNSGATVWFRNSKSRRHVCVKSKGGEIYFESEIDEVSIRARIMLREFAAHNKLPHDKNDAYIRVTLGSDAEAAKRLLREVLSTAFATPLENMTFEVNMETAGGR